MVEGLNHLVGSIELHCAENHVGVVFLEVDLIDKGQLELTF